MPAVTVHSVVTGRPGGPVLVLSNPLGSTHTVWDALLAPLEKRFRVVRYDTRGHGQTGVPNGPYVIDDLADDLIALLIRLDVDRAHIVGSSLGGMTAMRIAARNPERVDRLAVLCTATRLPPAASWTGRAATVRAQGTTAVAAGVIERWFTPAYLDAQPQVRQAHEAMIGASPSEGYASCCEAIAALDLRDDLGAIAAPTLVIAGAEDLAVPPAMLQEIADGIADSTLLVVANAAHLALAEQPATITSALIDHLDPS